MAEHIQPILTIGIIYKNEIRCLERCLRSLAPLRKSISCELIMADTGSNDGSREIAAAYADILFDFPWIDDFSAARNAIMDKASGKWYLTIDADEYLDPDIYELTEFLRCDVHPQENACTLIQRNYESEEMDGDYFDFMAMRMVKMSAGLRYEGRIHEAWQFPSGQTCNVHSFVRTILHHNGYAGLNKAQGDAKRKRNLKLIREELSCNPEDLRRLLQYIESGAQETDFIEMLRKAIALIKKKHPSWEFLGPPILRYAVREAKKRSLPELEEWIDLSQRWFPGSFFTRIDIEYIAFAYSWDKKDYTQCICQGEQYLKAISDYRAGLGDRGGLMYGSLICGSPYCEQTIRLFLADAYIKIDNPKRTIQLLNKLDCVFLDAEQTENMVRILWKLHMKGITDDALIMHFFEETAKPVPGRKQADERIDAFYRASVNIFSFQDDERSKDNKRPSHTLFLPLGEHNDLGRAAMILESGEALTIQTLLTNVENWDRFPISALAYAIEKGISFPLPGKPLKSEETDKLAARLVQDKERFFNILFRSSRETFTGSLQKLMWIKSLVLIAIRVFDWNQKAFDTSGISAADDTKNGIALARLFAEIEASFLPCYYSQDILQEENIISLPPLHRFGWYCVQAFAALEQGDPAGYARRLRDGLKICPQMNVMVEYLTKYTPQLQQKKQEVPPELQSLAKQVRTLLSAYPADDPAVAVIKSGPAYQKVKHLIENDNRVGGR